MRRLWPLLVVPVCVVACSHGPRELDPQNLPPLPPRVLAVQREPDAVLVRLDGTELGRLAGYEGTGGEVFVRGARAFRLHGRRLRPLPKHGATSYREVFTGKTTNVGGRKLDCEQQMAKRGRDWVVGCIGGGPGALGLRSPDGRISLLVPAPRGVAEGFWWAAYVSPDGARLLLEWVGGCETPSGECRTTGDECEVSTVYLAPAEGGEPRRIMRDPSAEATALGWTDDGRPLVFLPDEVCGQRASKPGVYSVEAGLKLKMLASGGSHATLLRP